MKNKISHEGHRQRLKNRFLSSSLDNFEPHNILELLLFYSIPRQDTNEIAHALLNQFGSIKGVFDADFNDLITVPGIKENSATLLKMIPHLCRAYMLDSIDDKEIFDTYEKVGNFLMSKYVGETNEVVYFMVLDNKYKLLNCVRLSEGSVNSSAISQRVLLDIVVKHKASMAIIAHNHPNGLPFPTMEDMETTRSIQSSFEILDVHLLEHFLVAGNDYVPIIRDVLSYPANTPRLK